MNRKSILLVEDSKLHQSFIQRALEGTRFDLAVAESGIEGLYALSKKRYDAVLIDLMLPDLGGLSVVRTMREMKQLASLPVLLISSRSASDYEAEIAELNISAFIEKGSFKNDEFIQQLEQAIESTEKRREIELLLLEPSEGTQEHVRRATAEPRFIFSEVPDRNTLEAFAASALPDVVLYAQPEHSASETPQWILGFHLDGILKEVPWVVLFPGQVPREFAALCENRLIMPLATPCSDIVLKKSIEILAQIHQTRLSSQEHSLELELACGELDKNRIALTQARSELTLRKDTFGDILLKVGDEVRRPLTAILGYSEGLKLGSQHDSWRSAVDAIANNGKYLAQVVDDILSIAAIEKGRFQVHRYTFDLLALVNDIKETARIRARANNVSFAVRFENDVPAEVESDPVLLKQILRGLLDNAVKFTTEGSIELKVAYDESLNRLRLVVRDSGAGIPAEKLATILSANNIATPSTNTIAAGSGFGVTYVRFAAEQLGGEMRVESKPGEGSTFTVFIDPGDCSETLSPELAYTILELGSQDRETIPETLKGRVLISDASVESQRLHRFLLARTGLDYSFVKDGLETLERTLSEDIDLLLIDILHPESDGFAFVRALRKRGFNRPIFCLSSFQFQEQKQRAIDVGCDAVLDTPFRVEQYYQTLAQLLGASPVEQQDAKTSARESTIPLAQSDVPLPELPQAPAILLPQESEHNALVESLLLEFLDMLPQQLARVESSLMSRDLEAAKDASDELLQAASTYGYPSLVEAASQFSELCGHSDLRGLRHLLEHLRALAEAARAAKPQLFSEALPTVQTASTEAAAALQSEQTEDESQLQEEIHSLFVDEPDVSEAVQTQPKTTAAESASPSVDETAFFSSLPFMEADDANAEDVYTPSEVGEAELPDEHVSISTDALLERVGDALMSGDWKDAAQATRLLQQHLDSRSVPEAQAALARLSAGVAAQSVEQAAIILDQLNSIFGQTEEPQPASERGAADDENEITMLLKQLEAEVGPLSDAEEQEEQITDTSIYSIFGADMLSDAGEDVTAEAVYETEEYEEHTSEEEPEAGSAEDSEPMTEEPLELSSEDALRTIVLSEADVVEEGNHSSDAEDQAIPSLEEAQAPDIDTALRVKEEDSAEPVATVTPLDAVVEDSVATTFEATPADFIPSERIDANGTIYSTLVAQEPSTAPLILDFLDELKDLVVQLRSAFGREDDDMMKRIIDEVYGSAGICGYESCAEIAQALTKELDAGVDKERVAPLLSEFETVCEAMFRGRRSLLESGH